MIVSDSLVMLIDSPLRIEDGREWLGRLAQLGEPRYLVLLDQHPDRALGARGLDLSRVAHDFTRQALSAWSDTFKGSAHPIGAEADRLKRITGVSKAIPDISFAEEMQIHLGQRVVHLWHR
ncbi:MAG: hypothetical protein GTO63_00935, partial [Anaerolineae bacterium]|nr:hypothetical protein [Anaerolineae bacterium]NIN93595.1 hypothetical protein [Anaerolineae bacterium]